MQAMLCGCNRRLKANNYEELVEEVLGHLLKRHSGIRLGETQIRAVREIVAIWSYRLDPVKYEEAKEPHEREGGRFYDRYNPQECFVSEEKA